MKLRVFRAVGTTLFFGLRHFPAFYLLGLLINLPIFLYIVVSGQNEIGPILADKSWQNDLLTIAQIVLSAFATAVMALTLIRDRQDESWTVFAALRDAFERTPTILGVGVAIAVATTMLSIVADVLKEVAPLAAFIPVLILSILSLIFALAMPCAAIEDVGVLDCFGQSALLTSGSRWRILAAYFLVSIPLTIVGGAVAIFLIFLLAGPFSAEEMKGLPASWIFLGTPVFNLFFLSATVAIHEQLAELDDGVELGRAAAVFD